MKITQEFVVAKPVETVWELFQDVPTVAGCLPGAELLGRSEDGSYQGRLSVKLGPMTAAFEGNATVAPQQESYRARIEGKGVDKKGGSRGQVRVDYTVESSGPGSSKVTVDADVTLSGPAAQFGRTGLINEMSKRLIGEFVACLEAKLGADSQEEAEAITASEVRGISLFLSALWSALKRLFRGGRSPA